MALSGFTYTDTPANGHAAGIRTALAGGLSANWTVNSLVTFGTGNDARSYFTMDYTGGEQVLFAVGDGINEGGSNLIPSEHLGGGFDGTDLTLWVALDPNGGGVGSDSFTDNLYNNALDPATLAFWNQTEKSRAHRLVEWFEGSGSTTLYVIEETTDASLLFYTNGNGSGRLNSISLVILSDNFLDLSSRPVGDQYPKTHGIAFLQADTDSGGNDLSDWEQDLFPGGGAERDAQVSSPGFWWLLSGNTTTTDPDAEGNTIRQTIPLTSSDDRIRGIVNRDLLMLTPNLGSTALGKRVAGSGGAYLTAIDAWSAAWDNALGDIIP